MISVLLAGLAALASVPAAAAATPVAAAAPATVPPAAAGARWQWPLAGTPRVLRGFEPPATPYAAGHRGVDLGAAVGAAVLAAGAGAVGYAGMLAGRGVVTVVHGSLRTTYEPVTASVHPGQLVSRGTVIGHLQGGPHCGLRGPCLHWGLLRGAVYLDPLSLLGLNAVRLLPVWAFAPGARSGGPAPPVDNGTVPPLGAAAGGGRAVARAAPPTVTGAVGARAGGSATAGAGAVVTATARVANGGGGRDGSRSRGQPLTLALAVLTACAMGPIAVGLQGRRSGRVSRSGR